MFLAIKILMLILFMQFSAVSCDTFYIVTSPSSPCPGEYIGVPCLTLQQYASNLSRSQNITFLVEPGMYNLSTVLTVSIGYNFTMLSTNATVTCTSATAKFEFNTVENVHISGITFQGCKNTAIRMLRVTSAGIMSSNFTDNQALSGSSRYGGCLYITSSSVTISESEFRNNRATYGGGAIHAEYSNITIDSSVFDNNIGDHGGTIYCSSGIFQIVNITFLNNRAYEGGAIYATQVFTNSSVSQCQFISSVAYGYAGAMYISESNVTIVQCQFFDNIASGSGGAVYMSMTDITTTVIVAQCQFRNNSARGQGGALYMNVRVSHRINKAITMITQCQIINNTATSHGGGIYMYIYVAYLNNINTDVTTIITKVTQCTLTNNEASGNGGAIYVEKDTVTTDSITKGNISVNDCQFVNNTAGGSGGAMYKTGSNDSIMVDNNHYSSNIANTFGGSLYISGTNSLVSVTDSTFISNAAITEGGGAIYSNGQYHYHFINIPQQLRLLLQCVGCGQL